jgi:ATP-dependent exoDNAse (exonuclease V) alpha subunit
MLTTLNGQIERITFTNEENGFTIAKVKVRGRRELVTVVGVLMSPMPGEILDMQGEWTSHPQFGEQFKVAEYRTKIPATVYGIRKYLGSGLIKGLGPVMAGRIVDRFDKTSLDIIENDIQRLAEVAGIGKKRIAMIAKAWDAQREIRDVMLFLQSHGVSSGYATKIFKQYGNRSIAVVKQNPYRLATDIYGIGFVTADQIAAKLGIAKNAGMRVEAGILYVLYQLSDEGHVYFPYEPLISKSCQILEVEGEAVVEALDRLAVDQMIVMEDLHDSPDDLPKNSKAVFLAKFHLCESSIARRIKVLVNFPKSVRDIDSDKAIEWVQGQLAITLADKQIAAVRCAIENKAIPPFATFILVGDVNQLPSVGAGNILKDIIASSAVPVVVLDKIFRQAQTSQIIVNAHKINEGIVPFLDTAYSDDPHNDFYFIEQEDPEKILDIILELTKVRIPQRFGFDPVNEIQVLTPMHRGVVGSGNLNQKLQAALNPGEGGITRGEVTYRANDKVMQIRNNYDREVFNGDIGRITVIEWEDKEVMINFDGREVVYDFSDLDEIVSAYAVSVHKSQGSEYAAVIIPIVTQHYILLQRNLIYTAVTRGKKLVVMVGSRKAMAIGVNNNKTRKRFTRLCYRLM